MIMGRVIGMGPVRWQKHKVNKCEEFHKLTCEPDIDKCCAVVRCEYCLTFDDAYGGLAISVATTEDGITWRGTVSGIQVELILFRDYSTNECFLRVVADDEIWEDIPLCTARGDGTESSCQDFSGEAEVLGGVLAWYALSKRKLHYVPGEDGCITQYCGNCECACKDLCIAYEDQISGPDNTGTLTMVSLECETPRWEGTTSDGSYSTEIVLTLIRDEVGQCRFTGTVGGVDVESEPVTDCENLYGQIFMAGNIRVGVRCKGCEECNQVPAPPCCDYSLPETLNAQVSFGNCPAGPCTVDVPLSRRVLRPGQPPLNIPTIGWYGVAASACGNMQIVVACNFSFGEYRIELYSDQCTGAPIANWPVGFGQVAATVTCNPFFMSGTSTPSFACCPGQTTLTTFSVSL
jgi:hypothetical protein